MKDWDNFREGVRGRGLEFCADRIVELEQETAALQAERDDERRRADAAEHECGALAAEVSDLREALEDATRGYARRLRGDATKPPTGTGYTLDLSAADNYNERAILLGHPTLQEREDEAKG